MCLYSSPYRQNDYGQIGSGSNENAVVPRFVEGVDHVSKVTCGANHSLALTGTIMIHRQYTKFCPMLQYLCQVPVTSLSLICSIISWPCTHYARFYFHKNTPAQISWTTSLPHRADVTSQELSLCTSKITYFTQFYANIRALKPSIGTSPERGRQGERERKRERVLARIWPWLLIHNSHCLLHTFQNSFRLWR